jgi:hypothetical protein
MTDAKPDPLTAFLIERFKHAALVAHYGHEDEDDALQIAGINAAERAVQGLDAIGPDGRRALIPLLDDPDWGIRAYTAGYLVRLFPDRALAVLEEISTRAPTAARMTACRMQIAHEQGRLNL